LDIRPIGNSVLPGTVPTPAPAPVSSPAPSPAPAEAASVAPASTVQQSAAVPNMDQLTQAVKDINKAMESMSSGLEFAVDPDSHRTVVKIVDQKTQEVIRQIPSKQTLEIAQALDHWNGLLIKQQA